MNNNRRSGYGFYFILLAIILIVMYFSGNVMNRAVIPASIAAFAMHAAMNDLPVPVGWMTAALPLTASIAVTASYAS